MELKVWVEGIQRIVCGVTLTTTCQDVVFALAHATGKVGRFTLIERWRNNERLLAPNENPLKILLKWGEYSNDVQFILQRSDQSKRDKSQNENTNKNVEQNSIASDHGSREKLKESPKMLDLLSETKQVDNVGIVKGVPQKPVLKNSPQKNKNDSLDLDMTLQFGGEMGANFQSTEFNMADIRSSLHKKTNSFDGNRNFNPENLIDMLECKKNNCDPVVDLLTTIAPISSNGALVPPPYRDPPPPRSSPLQKIDNFTTKKFEIKEGLNSTTFFNNNDVIDSNENYFQTAQYKDLVQLIKFQTDKISSQQADLTKFDAEIVYLENKERDQMEQLDAINMEITKTDHILRQGNEQLQTLQYVEEENELVRQQEKTLKSEITLLRSKLANCETELLQCRNKIRLLMDDIQIEQRAINNRQKDNRQQVERSFMTEVEKIQSEIDQAIQNADTTSKTTENLKKEVVLIENAIAEKKRQVEQLVNEMKEVNLQSLAVAPSDEIKHLLEGSNRPGSTRRIIGSPRQLENAVPTSKNPHGVWV